MKKALLTAMTVLIVMTTQAQFEITPNGNPAELTVNVTNLYADLEIVGTNDKLIKVIALDYEGLPEKAKGLKPLSATGPDNTDLGLYIEQQGQEIMISGASRKSDDGEYRIELPANIKLVIEYDSYQAGDIRVSDMSGEVEASSKVGDMEFQNITGPLVANSLSSDISIVFTSVSQTSPTDVSSTSGDVDVTLPESTKGNFQMKTVSGEVYTDLEFEFGEEEGRSKRWGGGMSAEATLNGGGVQINLKSISGDIFIRKQ
ncbi:MAG: DUF4097 family beta strand repeat-containing protein [Cytophagales bacterium]|nr:DUF4097 family beta strand repeat-containing protein [Cytophagales bacterium]